MPWEMHAVDAQYDDHRSGIRDTIRQYIVDSILFGDAGGLDDTVSFQQSGVLDSVGFLEVITFVEKQFGIQIVDGDLVPENFDTVSRIADFIHDKLNAKAGSEEKRRDH